MLPTVWYDTEIWVIILVFEHLTTALKSFWNTWYRKATHVVHREHILYWHQSGRGMFCHIVIKNMNRIKEPSVMPTIFHKMSQMQNMQRVKKTSSLLSGISQSNGKSRHIKTAQQKFTGAELRVCSLKIV